MPHGLLLALATASAQQAVGHRDKEQAGTQSKPSKAETPSEGEQYQSDWQW